MHTMISKSKVVNEQLDMHQILTRVLPEALHGRLAYLSGPSFAAEVARELPTVVTIASTDDAVAARAQVGVLQRQICILLGVVRGAVAVELSLSAEADPREPW